MREQRANVRHRIFASLYPRMSRALDRAGIGEHRRALLGGLTGEVIEVGAGDGAMFAHYPPSVTRVLAVEPEPRLRALAVTAAAAAPVPVEVTGGLAGQLPAAAQSVDAVVFALVLCSVPDQAEALAEARRVLKPGGQIRFLEHVRAGTPGWARTQRILDATIWPPLMGGCHTGRDTTAAICEAGFGITALDRFLFPPTRTPASFFVLGTATRR